MRGREGCRRSRQARLRGHHRVRGCRGQVGAGANAIFQGSTCRDPARRRSARPRACAEGRQGDQWRRRIGADSRSLSRAARRIRCLELARRRYRRGEAGEAGQGSAAVGAERLHGRRRRNRWMPNCSPTCTNFSGASSPIRPLMRIPRIRCGSRTRTRWRRGTARRGSHFSVRAGLRQDAGARGLRDPRPQPGRGGERHAGLPVPQGGSRGRPADDPVRRDRHRLRARRRRTTRKSAGC